MKKILLMLLFLSIAVFAASSTDTTANYGSLKDSIDGLQKVTQQSTGNVVYLLYGLLPIGLALLVALVMGGWAFINNKQEQGSGAKIFMWGVVGLIIGGILGIFIITFIADFTLNKPACGMEFHNLWWTSTMKAAMGISASTPNPTCLN